MAEAWAAIQILEEQELTYRPSQEREVVHRRHQRQLASRQHSRRGLTYEAARRHSHRSRKAGRRCNLSQAQAW